MKRNMRGKEGVTKSGKEDRKSVTVLVEEVKLEDDDVFDDEMDHASAPPSPYYRRRDPTKRVASQIRSVYGRVQKYLTEPGASDGSASTVTTSSNSPVNKRRFPGRKWLPPPLRKLSQGKLDKPTAATPDAASTARPLLKKTASDKRIKIPSDMGNKQVSAEEPPAPEQSGEEQDEEVELPPPMKPLSEAVLVAAGAADDAAITKREQHTENRERQRESKAASDSGRDVLCNENDKDCTPTVSVFEAETVTTSLLESNGIITEVGSGSIDIGGGTNEMLSAVESIADNQASALQKRHYVIAELVETEKLYVKDLRDVIEGYMAHMRDPNSDIPVPEDLKGGKDKMVFGNIEAIYEWHRDFFMKALEKCLDHPEELGPLFRRYERKLHMYVIYCQNKPVSEFIVSEYMDTYFEEIRIKLGHKLQLCDLLIKPVQRIMKYQLLIRDILKYTEKAALESEIESLRQAVHIMHIVPKAANDMMNVGRLQGFDGKITAQGKLLLHGILSCCEGSVIQNFKGKDLQIFLFEQNIIFSEAVGKKTQFTNPVYIYKAHIQVNKMTLDENPDESDPLKFVIRSTDPRKPNLAYVCQGSSQENRDEWVSTIKTILQTQRDFLKAIQSPIAYQKELTKEV